MARHEIKYNMGRKATVLTFEKLNATGRYTVKGCAELNRKRLKYSASKNQTIIQTRRKVIRGSKNRKEDVDNEKEGTL